MEPFPTLHARGIRDVVQSVIVPVVAAVVFFLWVYALIEARSPKLLIFPSISIAVLSLYFFSGHVHAGIYLCFVSAVSFLGLFIPPFDWSRPLFIAEAMGIWVLFSLIDRYRKNCVSLKNRLAEKEETNETKIALLESRIQENRRSCDDLNQRIFNYQMLGRMIEVFGVTLKEEKIMPLVSELAGKFIRRGTWKVKKGAQNDVFAQYVKDHRLPVIVQNIAGDSRFYVPNPRFASLIALPIEVNGRYWGVLKGTAHQPNAFNETDLRLLSVLGGITSLVLNNCHLYQITQDLAISDSLTGLYVQSYFRERLEGEIVRSSNHGIPLSVAIIDVDNFKGFNDAYGHAGGDVILRHIAMLLRRRLRETDFLSRYGGEEFAIIMVQTDVNEARQVIEEVRCSVEAERFFLPMESFKPVRVKATISAGISTLSQATANVDDLIHGADTALYRAKNNGRNRVEIDV